MHRKSICFLGNCQAFNISGSEFFSGQSVKDIRCSTLSFSPEYSFKQTKKYLLKIISEETYKMLGFMGLLSIQPSLNDITASNCKAIVCSMFPEEECYIHKSKKFILKINSDQIFKHAPLFRSTFHQEFKKIPIIYSTTEYFHKLKQFIIQLRGINADVPIFIIQRLSLFPFIWPPPKSLLPCWEDSWQNADTLLANITNTIQNTRILSLDKIAASICRTNPEKKSFIPRISSEYQFAKTSVKISFYSNTEYLDQSIWDYAALELIRLISAKPPVYSTEKIPTKWHATSNVNIPDLKEIEKMISTGNNLLFEKAISFLLLLWPEDHSQLIVKNKRSIQIDYRPLETLKKYIYLNPSINFIPLIDFLEQETSRKYKQNKSFTNYYKKTLTSLRKYIAYGCKKFDFIEQFQRILLWGAGGRGTEVIRLLKQLNIAQNIIGFIDSAPAVQDKTKNGLTIYNPDNLQTIQCDAIIITSSFKKEIMNQFDKLDFSSKPSLITLPVDLERYAIIHSYNQVIFEH